MKQENRHQAILYAVMRQGYVSIESLAEELGVSSQTIRRDISELDRTGMLERRPGGASGSLPRSPGRWTPCAARGKDHGAR